MGQVPFGASMERSTRFQRAFFGNVFNITVPTVRRFWEWVSTTSQFGFILSQYSLTSIDSLYQRLPRVTQTASMVEIKQYVEPLANPTLSLLTAQLCNAFRARCGCCKKLVGRQMSRSLLLTTQEYGGATRIQVWVKPCGNYELR